MAMPIIAAAVFAPQIAAAATGLGAAATTAITAVASAAGGLLIGGGGMHLINKKKVNKAQDVLDRIASLEQDNHASQATIDGFQVTIEGLREANTALMGQVMLSQATNQALFQQIAQLNSQFNSLHLQIQSEKSSFLEEEDSRPSSPSPSDIPMSSTILFNNHSLHHLSEPSFNSIANVLHGNVAQENESESIELMGGEDFDPLAHDPDNLQMPSIESFNTPSIEQLPEPSFCKIAKISHQDIRQVEEVEVEEESYQQIESSAHSLKNHKLLNHSNDLSFSVNSSFTVIA